MPSSMVVLIKTSMRRRFITARTSFFAELSSKQGKNTEVPRLNLRQSILYDIPAISIYVNQPFNINEVRRITIKY